MTLTVEGMVIHTMTKRIEELERENRQLREEIQALLEELIGTPDLDDETSEN